MIFVFFLFTLWPEIEDQKRFSVFGLRSSKTYCPSISSEVKTRLELLSPLPCSHIAPAPLPSSFASSSLQSLLSLPSQLALLLAFTVNPHIPHFHSSPFASSKCPPQPVSLFLSSCCPLAFCTSLSCARPFFYYGKKIHIDMPPHPPPSEKRHVLSLQTKRHVGGVLGK